MPISNTNKKLKRSGRPKSNPAQQESYSLGRVHTLPLFFLQFAHLVARFFLMSSASFPGYEIPAGASWSWLSPRGGKAVKLIGARGLHVGPCRPESRTPVWSPSSS
jgi:hypothetical protein